MKNIGKLILAIGITLLFTGSAISAELYSPAIGIHGSDSYLTCTVLNIGAKDVIGTIELCGLKGCVTKCELVGLPLGKSLMPGEFSSCSAKADNSGAAYCIYEIDVNPRDVRASACVTNGSSPFEIQTCVNAE